MDISSQIKKLRTDLNQTQAEFSKNIGVSLKTLSGYENGVSSPSIKVLLKIADFCGITVDQVIRGKANPKAEELISDSQLQEICKKINKMPKAQRDKIKWIIEAILEKEK